MICHVKSGSRALRERSRGCGVAPDLDSRRRLVAAAAALSLRDRLRDGMKRYPDQPALVHALIRLLAAAPEGGVRDGQGALALMRDVLAREALRAQPSRTPQLDDAVAR